MPATMLIGAVLSQLQNGWEWVIAYYSWITWRSSIVSVDRSCWLCCQSCTTLSSLSLLSPFYCGVRSCSTEVAAQLSKSRRTNCMLDLETTGIWFRDSRLNTSMSMPCPDADAWHWALRLARIQGKRSYPQPSIYFKQWAKSLCNGHMYCRFHINNWHGSILRHPTRIQISNQS